jgi:membrane-bound serine protease (ClpP class)
MKLITILISSLLLFVGSVYAADSKTPHIAVMDMEMGIFPGTLEYLRTVVEEAPGKGAEAILVNLDTPGGLLQASQDMVKLLFESKIPVIIYVSPTGATATSAGVFITMAGHIAAMAPGTTIGAAHPVQGDGKNIESDMRSKAENMTVAMVKSISEQRGRNAAWAEKAVKESASITEAEAIKIGVVDVVAKDPIELLTKISGKKVKIGDQTVELKNLDKLPLIKYEMNLTQRVVNTLSDPNIVQLLWLAATTGLSIELYNPGLIFPGVVGIICLILALAAYQVIPINLGGILLLVAGVIMIGAELFIPSGVLAIGGIIALVLGSIYLVDLSQMPGITINMGYVITSALVLGGSMLAITTAVVRAQKRRLATGNDSLVGLVGKAAENISSRGRLFVNGEYWKATCRDGIIEKGAQAKIVRVQPGMILEVEKI